MFTRFRTASAVHVFDAPLVKIPPDLPGGTFLAALGGAYECEESHLRSRLLQGAGDLSAALEQPDFLSRSGVPKFLSALRSVIPFLAATSENEVFLYSYDRAPSIEDLLDAFAEGGGSRDWAIEELGRKGEKGRKALFSALNVEKDKQRILSGISLLRLLFRDEPTLAAIRKAIENSAPDVRPDAFLVLAAYTST